MALGARHLRHVFSELTVLSCQIQATGPSRMLAVANAPDASRTASGNPVEDPVGVAPTIPSNIHTDMSPAGPCHRRRHAVQDSMEGSTPMAVLRSWSESDARRLSGMTCKIQSWILTGHPLRDRAQCPSTDQPRVSWKIPLRMRCGSLSRHAPTPALLQCPANMPMMILKKTSNFTSQFDSFSPTSRPISIFECFGLRETEILDLR
jgi:hypothetical protein